MVQQVTQGLVFIGLFSLVIFVIAGKYLLGIWGAEFITAYWALVIIAIGQLFNIGTGATGIILIKTGYEKILGYITISLAIFDLALNYILIPKFGATGAAIATATTLISENIIKVILVKIKTDIYTIPFIK
ncbi:MAG: polysaccharide biosynthesis C-terminal domain-containing protein [Bacteroidota bacterium]